jgi:ubiquinone/menaquinone biosynthesis C-methylase UbiE/septal ring factor EnvC (AmiA/AmiB activator)
MEMAFTGERYVPTVQGRIRYEHLHRYALALDFVRGKSVLDMASGEGYGSAYLSQVANSVIGVDIDRECINFSRQKYGNISNLEFIVGSCDAIPLSSESLDIVTSFETIEHHDKHDEMMREIRRVLKPGGVLVISAPNRLTYSEHPKSASANPNNQFHVNEPYEYEFISLLSRYFKNVKLYGQRLAIGSFVFPLLAQNLQSSITSYTIKENALTKNFTSLQEPIYFVAVCSDEIDNTQELLDSIFIDDKDDVLIELENETRDQLNQATSNLELKEVKLSELQDEVYQLQALLSNFQSQLQQTEGLLEQSQSQLQQTEGLLEQSQSQLQQTESLLEQSQSQLQQTEGLLEQSQSQLQQTESLLEQSQSQLQQTESLLEQSQSQLQQAEGLLEQSQSQLQQTEGLLEQSQSQLQQTEGLLEQSQSQLQQTEGLLEQSQSQLQQTEGLLEQSQSQLQQTEGLLEQSQSQLHETEVVLEQSQSQLQQTEGLLEQSQSQLHETEVVLEQSQSQLHETADELAQLQSQLQQTEDELAQLQSQLQQTEDELAHSQSQLQQTEDELAQSQSQLQQTEGLLEQSQSQVQQTEGLLEQSLSQIQHLQTDLDTKVSQLGKTQRELEEYHHKMQQVQSKIERLEFQQAIAINTNGHSKSQYEILVSEAWYAYATGAITEMQDSLKQSLKYSPFSPTNTVSNWLEIFTKLSGEKGHNLDTMGLTNLVEWKQLMRLVTSKR